MYDNVDYISIRREKKSRKLSESGSKRLTQQFPKTVSLFRNLNEGTIETIINIHQNGHRVYTAKYTNYYFEILLMHGFMWHIRLYLNHVHVRRYGPIVLCSLIQLTIV